jgi:hypothetical protein
MYHQELVSSHSCIRPWILVVSASVAGEGIVNDAVVVEDSEGDCKWEMNLLNLFKGTEESMKLLFMVGACHGVMGNHPALNLRVSGLKSQSENCQM